MKKASSLFRRAEADRKADIAPNKTDRELDTTELDMVAGGGGKAGAGSNPVDD